MRDQGKSKERVSNIGSYLVAIMIALSMPLINSTIPVVCAQEQPRGWMEPGRYYDFVIHTVFIGQNRSEDSNYRATVLDIGPTTVTLRENYSGEEGTYVEEDSEIDLNTREYVDTPGYYAWLWITEEDVQNGTVRIAGKVAQVIWINYTHVTLEVTEESGNHSFLYYLIEDYVLGYTQDSLFLNSTVETVGTTYRVGEGSGSTSFEEKDSLSTLDVETSSGNVEPLQFSRFYNSPFYDCGDTDVNLRGLGFHGKDIDPSCDEQNGQADSEGYAWAGPGWGYAYAWGQAWIWGPEEAWLSPPDGSRSYRIYMHYRVEEIPGPFDIWGTPCGWWGCGVTHQFGYAVGQFQRRGESQYMATVRDTLFYGYCLFVCLPVPLKPPGDYTMYLGRFYLSDSSQYRFMYRHQAEHYAYAQGAAFFGSQGTYRTHLLSLELQWY